MNRSESLNRQIEMAPNCASLVLDQLTGHRPDLTGRAVYVDSAVLAALHWSVSPDFLLNELEITSLSLLSDPTSTPKSSVAVLISQFDQLPDFIRESSDIFIGLCCLNQELPHPLPQLHSMFVESLLPISSSLPTAISQSEFPPSRVKVSLVGDLVYQIVPGLLISPNPLSVMSSLKHNSFNTFSLGYFEYSTSADYSPESPSLVVMTRDMDLTSACSHSPHILDCVWSTLEHDSNTNDCIASSLEGVYPIGESKGEFAHPDDQTAMDLLAKLALIPIPERALTILARSIQSDSSTVNPRISPLEFDQVLQSFIDSDKLWTNFGLFQLCCGVLSTLNSCDSWKSIANLEKILRLCHADPDFQDIVGTPLLSQLSDFVSTNSPDLVSYDQVILLSIYIVSLGGTAFPKTDQTFLCDIVNSKYPEQDFWPTWKHILSLAPSSSALGEFSVPDTRQSEHFPVIRRLLEEIHSPDPILSGITSHNRSKGFSIFGVLNQSKDLPSTKHPIVLYIPGGITWNEYYHIQEAIEDLYWFSPNVVVASDRILTHSSILERLL